MNMLDPAEKERLIEEFRACLDQADESTHDDHDAVDLHTLLTEMAALKNEIRLESRQFKSMLDEMRSFGEVLRVQNERLSHDLERARDNAAAGKQKAERALLLNILDLRDRLQAGVDAGAQRRPSSLARRLVPNETRFAQSLVEGLTLTLQRLDEVLANYRVRPIDAAGQTLDPNLMRVVGVESVPGKLDGQVLRETRRGFFHDTELLRAAEVIVNKEVIQP